MWSAVGRLARAGGSRQAARCLASAAAPSRVVKSPMGDVEVPDLTMTQYLWRNEHQWSRRTAITCAETGRSLTYGDVRRQCIYLAWGLLGELGMQPGEVLGIVLPNRPEFLVAVHGALEAGLVVTFANPAYTPEEVYRQFRDSGVRCLVTTASRLAELGDVRQWLGPGYRGTIVLDGWVGGAHHWDALLTRARTSTKPVTVPPPPNPRDLAVLPYSSGTTGLPKGVCLSHRNLVSNLQMMQHPRLLFFQPTTDSYQEKVLSILPFYHIYGFNIILNLTVSLGIHNITLPKFTPDSFVKALEVYKPTMMFVVPSLMMFLATHPMVTPEHLSSLKMIMSGAAPAKESLIQKFLDKAGHNIFVGQGYGMTESSPVATVMPLDRPTTKYDSCGQLAPGTEARIVSLADGSDQGPGETGELLVRGPQVMMGYFNNEKATRETIDSDGWLHTGDVAYYDEDGYFYIVDRTKELIKVKGNQVSQDILPPQEDGGEEETAAAAPPPQKRIKKGGGETDSIDKAAVMLQHVMEKQQQRHQENDSVADFGRFVISKLWELPPYRRTVATKRISEVLFEEEMKSLQSNQTMPGHDVTGESSSSSMCQSPSTPDSSLTHSWNRTK